MKNLLSIAILAAAFGAIAAEAQAVRASYSLEPSAAYSANEIKAVGTLNSGETGTLLDTASPPTYRAFVFEGNGRDRVEVTVTGGSAYVALADSTLRPIAGGMGGVATALPYHGPDTEAFYILVKGTPHHRLAVHLTKTPASPRPADATR
jgi:hypothetical protein